MKKSQHINCDFVRWDLFCTPSLYLPRQVWQDLEDHRHKSSVAVVLVSFRLHPHTFCLVEKVVVNTSIILVVNTFDLNRISFNMVPYYHFIIKSGELPLLVLEPQQLRPLLLQQVGFARRFPDYQDSKIFFQKLRFFEYFSLMIKVLKYLSMIILC